MQSYIPIVMFYALFIMGLMASSMAICVAIEKNPTVDKILDRLERRNEE